MLQIPLTTSAGAITASVVVGILTLILVYVYDYLSRVVANIHSVRKELEQCRRAMAHMQGQGIAKRPRFIILVRHGESMGNIDDNTYKTTPDYRVELTEKGKEQAREAGRKIRNITKDIPVWSFHSPYQRTRQTAEYCLSELKDEQILQRREDARLREQEFKGTFQDEHMTETKEERMNYGRFFFRFPSGESAADVYDRVSMFMDTLWRDFVHYDLSNGAVVIFTHGLTARIFLMRWFRWKPEDFEETRNPENGAVIVMERVPDKMEPHRTTMRLQEESKKALGLTEESLCYTVRDRKVSSLERAP